MALLIAASLWIAGLLGLVPPTFATAPPPGGAPTVARTHAWAPPRPNARMGNPRTGTLAPLPVRAPTPPLAPFQGTYNGRPLTPINPGVHVLMPDGYCAWTGQAEATAALLPPCPQ